jgi:putative ABC transport system permease protein
LQRRAKEIVLRKLYGASRRDIGVYWTMLFALASTLAVALLAVARQAWIAVRMMPSKALRV